MRSRSTISIRVRRARGVVLATALSLACAALAPTAAGAAVRVFDGTYPRAERPPSFDPSAEPTAEPSRLRMAYEDEAGQLNGQLDYYDSQVSSLRTASILLAGCEGDAAEGRISITRGTDDRGGTTTSVSMTVDGVESALAGAVQVDPEHRAFTFQLAHPLLTGRDWRCVALNTAGFASLDGARYFQGFAPKPQPQGCTRPRAETAGLGMLLPRAAMLAGYYDFGPDVDFADVWGLGTVICRDLTGDGQREMVVQMLCCTGGALTPWGIFRRNAQGEWRLAYARVGTNVVRLRPRGRRIEAREIASYAGACTRTFRTTTVRWDGTQFRTRTSKAFRTKRVKGCP